MIRELERMVRALSDQLTFMTMNPPSSVPALPPQPSAQHAKGSLNSLHLRQQNLPPVNPVPPASPQSFQQQQQQQQQAIMHGAWFASAGIAAPLVSHPTPPPLPKPPLNQRMPPTPKTAGWDETYLAVLGTQDAGQLRNLLAHITFCLIVSRKS
jgi:hypothetical protein